MNLLATKKGRLVTFGGLYLSEGLPAGLLMMAIATEIQRRGMGTAALGVFVTMLALPWTVKFMMGPFVDNLHIKRFGARKQWIVASQFIMLFAMAAAMFCMPAEVNVDKIEGSGVIGTIKALSASGIGLFAVLLLIHNSLAATQDVAIDALACQVLKPEERGFANGVMFSSTHAGYAIGGSGVLLMKGMFGDNFQAASVVILVLMAMILTSVVLFVTEKSAAQQMEDGEIAAPKPGEHGFARVGDQLVDYFMTIFRSVICTRNGILTLLLAITPIGALALSMLLSALIAPRLGMTDKELSVLNLATSLVWIAFCLLGGWLSDKYNRRLLFAIGATCTIIPSLWMAYQFKQAGWATPPDAAADGSWPREEGLMVAWWIATGTFSIFSGFSYGIKSAFYMDLVNPKIAATQFTALMALTNLTNNYSKVWQGQAIDADGWKWPMWKLLYVDCAIGLLFLVILFFIRPESEGAKAAGPMDE